MVPTASGGVEHGDLYIANVRRSGVTRLTTNPGDDDDPAWSRDGKRIAFRSERAGAYGIFVIGATGRGLKRLTSNSAFFDYGPAWSPDSTRIAFVSRRSEGTKDYQDEIDVIKADGTGRIRFPKLSFERVAFPPAWSPDGKQLVFQSGYESMFGSGYDLYVANADGTAMKEIARGGEANVHPVWASDGKWIYFLSNRDTEDDSYCHDVYVAGVDTSVVRRLTTSTERSGVMESGVDSSSHAEAGSGACETRLGDRWNCGDVTGCGCESREHPGRDELAATSTRGAAREARR